jgi:hypothetical protein
MAERKALQRLSDDHYLIERMNAGQVVPFIGAGISMGVKLLLDRKSSNKRGRMPSYRELLLDMIDLGDANDMFIAPEHAKVKQEALALIEAGDLMKAADKLEGPIDTSLRYKFLRRILNHLSSEPSLVHELVNILDFPIILTSNYDRLLEDVLYPTPEVLTHKDATAMLGLLNEGGRFVVKVHGDVTRPETIVLGWSMYERLHVSADQHDVALRDFLGKIFTQKTLLFLGCSMAGGEYTEYLQRIFRTYGQNAPHYAFVPEGSLTFDKKEEWRIDFGIHMIEFVPDATYSHVWEFLSQLKRGQKEYPKPGEIWSDFFTPENRPAYLRLQLHQEKAASSVRFITPSLTNALAHDEFIRNECKEKLAKFEKHVPDFAHFTSDTLEAMLARAHNIQDGIHAKKLEVRAVFLRDTLEKEIQSGSVESIKRYHRVVELVESYPLSLGIRAFAGNISKEEFEKYSFALIFTPTRHLPDITCAYASQATTNDYQTHIILVNTRQVTQRCEAFERFWTASMNERDTLELIKQRLKAI